MDVILRPFRRLIAPILYSLPSSTVASFRLKDLAKNKNENIILVGSPGAGKTVVGRILSKRFGMPPFDIDNDWLERVWGMPVSDKLDQLGPDGFIQAEGEALMQCPVNGHVVSLTGSNPMHQQAIDRFRQTGIVIFLDVDTRDILSRLGAMKVGRIVGQSPGVSLEDILSYRQQFYENCYDIRILTPRNASPETQADLVQSALENMDKHNKLISTRDIAGNNLTIYGFLDAVLQGLALDGGLLVPNQLPQLSLPEWERLIPLSYQERAVRILERWISPTEVHPSTLKEMINRAYNHSVFLCASIAPVAHLEFNHYIQELYHGPTASFKDLALQLMPQFFQQAVHRRSHDLSHAIVVATSGDTGGASLDGFNRHTQVPIMALYPKQGVSNLQRMQMTTAEGDHVHVVGVKGDFDRCQTAVKRVLRCEQRAEHYRRVYGVKLSSANSINWGRLLPQIVYHASGYLDLVAQSGMKFGDPLDVCVPTGNFGNILAAFYAKKMGIPFGKLVVASNQNNVLTEFFSTGQYVLSNRSLRQTISPAIDILKSSNIERLLYHLTSGDDAQRVKAWFNSLDQDGHFEVKDDIMNTLHMNFSAGWCSEENSLKTIHDTFKRTGLVLDPHTAVAKHVADNTANQSDKPVLISATAHPSKFAHDVMRAIRPAESFKDRDVLSVMESTCGQQVKHDGVWGLQGKTEKHTTLCEGNDDVIADEIEAFLAKHSNNY